MIYRRIFQSIFIFLVFLMLASCGTKYPHVIIITEIGTIELEIYSDKAPYTANNFLQYIEERRYKGATFYRSVRRDNQPGAKEIIEVVQGGLFEDEHPAMLPPIIHESTKQSGIRHTNGIISMARYEPGTAASEFFICIGPQPALDYGGSRNPDGEGFAAFGKVVDGMAFVEQIHRMPTDGQYLNPRIRILDVILK